MNKNEINYIKSAIKAEIIILEAKRDAYRQWILNTNFQLLAGHCEKTIELLSKKLKTLA